MVKVMVFGTFDILHPGHKHMLNEAKMLGDYLVVVVARNKTVRDVKKHDPLNDEKTRLTNISKLNIADRVILGNESKDKHKIILVEKPEIIALGYDQKFFVKTLHKKFGKKIKIVKLKPYKENIYKSSKLK